MDSNALDEIRKQLDFELGQKDAHIGIAFGSELYKAFGRQGWFTAETFSVLGTGTCPIQVLAYGKSHNAISCWELDEWEYKVGSRDA